MNGVYKRILQNLINSDCSLPIQSNEFYEYIAHIAKALPDFLEKIDLDSNPPSYQEGDPDPVPDWIESIFQHDGLGRRTSAYDIWNESLKDLWNAINQYSKSPEDVDGKDLRTVDIYKEPKADNDQPIHTMLVDDIRYGDAGAKFLELLQQYTCCVKPEENLVGQKYEQVRGVDYVLKQVINNTYLQFTNRSSIDSGDAAANRGIIHSQIRLLIPKNSRLVLIEDLNRNFWVLGNCIGGLCAYLFGSGSPLKDIFQKVISELVQLWENVILLWVMSALALLKPCTDIHIELFFVPNSINELYKKYDNFDKFQSIPGTKARIVANTIAYAKKYQNSNCVMFPIIRKNNYEKSYFDWGFIPFAIFIIRQADGSDKVIVQDLRDKNDFWVQAHPVDYATKLWCAREVPTKYYYAYPLSEIPMKTVPEDEGLPHKYYAGFRPNISIAQKEFRNGNIYLNNVTIDFIDAIGQSFGKEDLTSITFNFPQLTSASGDNYKNQGDKVETLSSQEETEINIAMPTTQGYSEFQSYYLGEFPTTYDCSAQGKHFIVISEDSLTTQALLIKVGQYLPKLYNDGTNYAVGQGTKIYTANIYNNNKYFSEQTNSSREKTSYELNYTPNEYSWYSRQGLSINNCDFYVCNARSTCFTEQVDLNANVTEDDNAWTRLKNIGFDVISDYLDFKNMDKITYLMGAIGVLPWRNSRTQPGELRQGYWEKTILTHMYRFIPHKLIDFWDKYGKSNVETREFYINGEKCYLEYLGFVGKIETAYGGGANFLNTGTTWRLPELRSSYDDTYNDFLELQDTYDTETKYYLDMSKYSNTDPLKIEYDAAIQSSDWTNFQQFLSQHYEDYKDDFLSEITVGENITTLAGLWAVYDGNVHIKASEVQPEPVNHVYHEKTFLEDGVEKTYRQVGNLYFIFEGGSIKLPTTTTPVNINGNNYYAYSRSLNKNNPSIVNGSYIMQDDNSIKSKTVIF